MSLLEHTSSIHSSAVRLDDLEDAFRAWVHDPVKPDVVGVGQNQTLAMVELAHRLRGSQATLADSACAQLGLPPGVTTATAAAELLHATIDPDGPRCRSFRSASYYLRGLAHLGGDLPATSRIPKSSEDPKGRPDVR